MREDSDALHFNTEEILIFKLCVIRCRALKKLKIQIIQGNSQSAIGMIVFCTILSIVPQLVSSDEFGGNVLGIGLALLQHQFGFLKLPKESYYIETVPIHFDPWVVVALNLGTLALCTLVLFLPSLMVQTISPVKAIRLD